MNRVLKKIGVGILIWAAMVVITYMIVYVLPGNKWTRALAIPIYWVGAWLVFRLVRERDPEGGLDSLECFGYFMLLTMSAAVAWILFFPNRLN